MKKLFINIFFLLVDYEIFFRKILFLSGEEVYLLKINWKNVYLWRKRFNSLDELRSKILMRS